MNWSKRQWFVFVCATQRNPWAILPWDVTRERLAAAFKTRTAR